MPQVDVFVGDELIRVMMLPQARYLKKVLLAIEGSLTSFKGRREGAVGLGGGSGVKNWSVGRRMMWDRLAKLAIASQQDTLVPMIFHPCLAPLSLVSPCLCFLRPMLG